MAFDISMGLRKDDSALRRELDDVLARRAPQIQALLHKYGVPVVAGDRLAASEQR